MGRDMSCETARAYRCDPQTAGDFFATRVETTPDAVLRSGQSAPRRGGLCRMGHQPELTSHSWLASFCACLMSLQPHLPFVRAVQHAVASYCYAKELPPEQAAAIFARKCRTCR
jgi:hypothetical protein